MAIHLKQVNVRNLGPISKLELNFSRFNLIYGHNEMGKTFLTEYLIASLFKDRSAWSLRNLNGQGSVFVEGLGSEEVVFSPEGKKKLEDYWEDQSNGLPTNLARLLVVRGGQPAISQRVSGGVGRYELKQIVSQDVMLDQILGQFQATVRDARLNGGVIEGDRRGKIRDREQAIKKWNKRTDLLKRVHAEYSAGGVQDLEIKRTKFSNQLEKQTQAKRYEAFLLDKQISELEGEETRIDENDLNDLREYINREENLKDDIDKINASIEEKQKLSKQYNWLSNATLEWEEKSLGKAKVPGFALVVLAALTLIAGFLVAVLGEMVFQGSGNTINSPLFEIIGAVVFLMGLVASGFWFWRVRKWSENIKNSEERNDIQEGFLKRFGKPVESLTDLKTQFDLVKTADAQVKEMNERLQGKVMVLDEKTNEIELLFWKLTGEEFSDPETWRDELSTLNGQRKELEKNLNSLKLELKGLNVEESEYRPQPAEIDYDKDEENRLRAELEELNTELSRAKMKLEGLEAEVMGITNDPIGTSWATLVHNLQDACRDSADDYKDLTAHILAAIGLSEVLGEVREREDEQIQQAINSPEVINTLQAITDHYSKLEMIDDTLFVSGKFGEYRLSDLSTGIREQIQLALRMGMARRYTAGIPLFMIMDDAFQHSDWIRREKLFDLVLGMVDNGWQMIYLTMDDHIRDTALNMANAALGEGFRYFEISE